MEVDRIAVTDLTDDLRACLHRGPFMSSPGFARLWHTVGGQPVAWTVHDKGVPLAALPGVEFGRRGFTRFQSMPDGCYGSMAIVDSTADQHALSAMLFEGLASAGYLRAYVTDFSGAFNEPPGFSATTNHTLLVDITSDDWQPPDAKIRSEIRKAEREGVEVEPFDVSRHGEAFWQLVRMTESRHGRQPKYPREFFQALAGLATDDDRVVWLYVGHDGEPAASHIYFVEGDQLLHWQGYFDKRFSFLKPGQFLTKQAVDVARSRGLTALNMGASPADAADLVAYKQKWGGREHRYATLQRRSWLGRFL